MKIRKHIAIASAACMMLTGTAVLPVLSVSAEEEKQYETSGSYNDITWNYDKETKTLALSGTGETGTFDALRPDRVGGQFGFCPWGGFRNELEHVIVTEGITKIGYGLFADYYYLKSVQLPESLTEIDSGAFADCFCLTDISIPESVTEFGANAFHNTAWLNIQRSQKEMTSNAYDCFIIQNGVLLDGTLYGLLNYVRDMQSAAFSDVEAIGDGAFYKADHIGIVDLSNTLIKRIGDFAFERSSITSLTLPNDVKSIGENICFCCPDLEKVTIENAMLKIPDSSLTFCNTNTGDKLFTGTICGYTDSTAQAYAEKYGYKFESIGNALPVVQGDFDYYGLVQLEDAQGVLKYYTQTLAGKKPLVANTQKQCADVNGDGAADVMDAQYILKYYTETEVAGLDHLWKDILK